MTIPTTLVSSSYGQKARIVPVTKVGGPYEGKWQVKIECPGGKEQTIYSLPSVEAASRAMASELNIPLKSITVHYNNPCLNQTSKKRTPMTRSSSRKNKPHDKFDEMSPTGRALCHECCERIARYEPRVGIQKWKYNHSCWQPDYFHLHCCTVEMLYKMKLKGGKGETRQMVMRHKALLKFNELPPTSPTFI